MSDNRRTPLEIRDPIHGPITVNEDELKVIDSPYVQRLRGIKQLGFADLTFPGATHNRYSHSLGAFHLAGKAFDHIFHDFTFADKQEWQRFRTLIRLAALLHDSGHGPLSHAIEQVMPPKKDVIGGEGQASHEDFTEAIILKSSLNAVLVQTFGKDIPLALVSLIRNENRIPQVFEVKMGGQTVSLFPLLSALISGEIDVDRMDYMARDSLYCGIPYGHFDRDWIFSNLTYFIKDSKAYLALDSRAIYAVEDYLLSRYHLYLIVYLHHKSVIYDEMLYQFLSTDETKTRLPSSVDEYLMVDDYWLRVRLLQSKNPWAKRIINQQPYKLLLEVRSDQKEESKKIADELEAKLKKSNIGYFRSSSTGLLSKYSGNTKNSATPIYVMYRDPRFTSSSKPGADHELLTEATELFARYKDKKIIDRIFAERQI